MTLPKTYKAAVIEKANTPFVIKELELKQPGPGQVLVKVLASGVCHSDAVVVGAIMGTLPRVPGHETIGDVVAVGSGVERWKVGDRVGGGWHGGHDGVCKSCNRGKFQVCEKEEVNGVSMDGGHAEYVLLRSEATVSIPKEADPVKSAPLLCAGVTVFNAMRNQNVIAGSTVAILGLGGLGHLALQYANKLGYRVVALSSSASKKDFATKLGAHDYIDGSKGDTVEQLQKMGGADMIVCTAPSADAITALFPGLAPFGKMLVVALPSSPITCDLSVMVPKGTSMITWPSGHALDSEEAVKFAQGTGVECMVEKFSLEDTQKAYEHMLSGKVRFRSVLVM